MTRPASFREAAAEHRVQAVPLAHLSLELGHLYLEDFAIGPTQLRRRLERVAPWAQAVRHICAATLPVRTARVSTCFLIDDYSSATSSPAEVVPELLQAARDCGLEIDYLARESGCAEADGVPVSQLVEERIVAEPPPGTNGLRPPVTETGWLCNGQRSPGNAGTEAMETVLRWRPPVESAANRHSVFVDVELWDEDHGTRTWSCAFLAAVWQLLRLGLLRDRGAPVAVPKPWEDAFPTEWHQLPAIVQLNRGAAPFTAYHTMSLLPGRFFPIEHAVRTILSQVAVDPAVSSQILDRGRGEGLSLPVEPVERIGYVFLTD